MLLDQEAPMTSQSVILLVAGKARRALLAAGKQAKGLTGERASRIASRLLRNTS